MPRPGRSGQTNARPPCASKRPPCASKRPPGASKRAPGASRRAPEGPEGLAAVPVDGGGAWPDNEPTRRTTRQHTRHHWCGGRRRARRARAGFEIDHSERSSRVAISRAAGPDGTQNTRGATSSPAHRTARTAPGTPVRPQTARPSGQPTATRTRRPRCAARAGTGRGSG